MHDGVTVIDLPARETSPDENGSADVAPLPISSFIAGPENRLAAVALQQLMEGDELPTDSAWFNPLVLTGPSGTGKSHLARGIARHWSRLLGESDVGYFTAIDFARQLHSARSDGQIELFRKYVAALQLLVIEDLQQLPRRTFIEREFRDTLDFFADNGGAVVITANEITCSDPGLRDRLQNGLVVRLCLPGVQARREILSQVSDARNLQLTDDQLQQLSQQLDGPAPRLMQALAELDLEQTTGQSVSAACHAPLKLKQVVAVVARYYSLTQSALLSSARRKSLVHARGVIVYLARLLTNLSYAEIGRGLGGRDHSTMIHAHRSLLELASSDSATQRDLDQLRRILSAN